MTPRRCLQAAAGLLVGSSVLALGVGGAQAYTVRSHGHVYGILPAPDARNHLRAGTAAGQHVSYNGGPVMLTNRLYLIFWGPRGSFAPTYQSSIVQWAQALAADSRKTTNEFSIGSLYYESHPRRYISRTVTYGGGIIDSTRYPANGCENPAHRGGVCLSDAELQAELVRDIRAEHWPTNGRLVPKDQYLLFTPRGVDSCQDRTETSCTFASKNSYCAYHSAFLVGSRAVVYSNLPYQSECDSGQSPAGAQGNADADGTLDSAIHEVLESATDPESTGSYDPGWITRQGYEVGDECDSPPQPNSLAVYGAPLGGALAGDTAFNQVIDLHTYYTQQIWALGTRWRPAQGCAPRIGPTPQFMVSSGPHSAGQAVTLDGTRSYDLVKPITQYAWNYGDGSPVDTSPGAQAAHIYTQPGTYQVSLTVTDAAGPNDASTQTQTLVVH